jgi:hypothetical protein
VSASADRLERERARWRAALHAYAADIVAHAQVRDVRVLDWFVDVRDPPYWIDLAVLDAHGALMEFYFNGELGWLQPRGEHCGRLTRTRGRTERDHAERVCIPARRVAAQTAAALRDRPWPTDERLRPGSWSTDEAYLAALLEALERTGGTTCAPEAEEP